MLKKSLLTVALIAVLVGAFFALNAYIYDEKQGYAAKDYKEAEYVIEGERVLLGETVQYFGNEVTLDLNKDGREDVVFLVTSQPGGSATFVYAVAALNTERGYVGSQGLLLGDRIAPQTTEIRPNNIVLVNYADRAPGDPFTAEPSVGKSIWLKLDTETMQFGEVAQNFEGESNKSTAGFGGEVSLMNVRIYPTELLEDSRCPIDVVCIQAGTVRIRARLVSGLGESPRQEYTLGKPVTTETEEVTLVEVLPVPKSTVSIKPSDYVFRFKIERH